MYSNTHSDYICNDTVSIPESNSKLLNRSLKLLSSSCLISNSCENAQASSDKFSHSKADKYLSESGCTSTRKMYHNDSNLHRHYAQRYIAECLSGGVSHREVGANSYDLSLDDSDRELSGLYKAHLQNVYPGDVRMDDHFQNTIDSFNRTDILITDPDNSYHEPESIACLNKSCQAFEDRILSDYSMQTIPKILHSRQCQIVPQMLPIYNDAICQTDSKFFTSTSVQVQCKNSNFCQQVAADELGANLAIGCQTNTVPHNSKYSETDKIDLANKNSQVCSKTTSLSTQVDRSYFQKSLAAQISPAKHTTCDCNVQTDLISSRSNSCDELVDAIREPFKQVSISEHSSQNNSIKQFKQLNTSDVSTRSNSAEPGKQANMVETGSQHNSIEVLPVSPHLDNVSQSEPGMIRPATVTSKSFCQNINQFSDYVGLVLARCNKLEEDVSNVQKVIHESDILKEKDVNIQMKRELIAKNVEFCKQNVEIQERNLSECSRLLHSGEEVSQDLNKFFWVGLNSKDKEKEIQRFPNYRKLGTSKPAISFKDAAKQAKPSTPKKKNSFSKHVSNFKKRNVNLPFILGQNPDKTYSLAGNLQLLMRKSMAHQAFCKPRSPVNTKSKQKPSTVPQPNWNPYVSRLKKELQVLVIQLELLKERLKKSKNDMILRKRISNEVNEVIEKIKFKKLQIARIENNKTNPTAPKENQMLFKKIKDLQSSLYV